MKDFHLILTNIISRLDYRKLFILRAISNLLFDEYRLPGRKIEWWQESNFNEYLERFGLRNDFTTYRRWMLYQLLGLTMHVPGDTVECGVFKGASSWLILAANHQNKLHQKMHFCFDSFEGLSEPSAIDGIFWRCGDLGFSEYKFKENLRPFTQFEIFKGWIPDQFHKVQHKTFSFIHIDVDLYEPTRLSLEFFYPRLNKGGIILCDDYGSSICPGATKACDEFLQDKPEKMIALDASGGFLIKGMITSRVDLSQVIKR